VIPVFVPVATRQITCIRKHEHSDPHHPIRWVGGADIPSGQSFQLTQEEVIAAIDSGDQFFVQGIDGSTSSVQVKTHFPSWSQQGIRYIATVADQSQADNLLSLPDCPPSPLDRAFPYG
jgi:Protein of unknown function (DUF3892)